MIVHRQWETILRESVLKDLGLFSIIKQSLSRNIIMIYKYARGVNNSERQVLLKHNVFM